MKIVYKHGDLMKAEEAFIAQGCNAKGVMGSGVAKLLRDADEYIFTSYADVFREQGNVLHLGQTIWVDSKLLNKVVINVITQENYGRDTNVVYVDYDGLRNGFREINDFCAMSTEKPAIAMPLIGAGLANGKWSIISQIIEEEAINFTPVVYLMDGAIPDGVESEIEDVRNNGV